MTRNPTVLSPQLSSEVQRLVRRELRRAYQDLDASVRRNLPSARKLYRAKVTTEITPAVGLVVGSGVCEVHRRDTATDTLVAVSDNFPVWNAGTVTYSVEDYVWIEQDAYGDYWVTDSDTAQPRIQWRAIGPIAMGIVPAVVTYTGGFALDVVTGDPLEVGDTLYVHDPGNAWPTICEGCSGWAFFAPETAIDEPISGDPATPARYEIEDATEPVDEISGTLEECGFPCDSVSVRLWNPDYPSSGTNRLACSTGSKRSHIKRSHDSASVQPPEFDFEGQPSIVKSIANRTGEYGVRGSEVIIRRTTNAKFAKPENRITPHNGSATEYEWQVYKIPNQVAMFISGKWATPYPSIDTYWLGDNPELCGQPSVALPFGTTCAIKDGDDYVAVHVPESGGLAYKVLTTESGLYGKPTYTSFVWAGDSPGNGPSMEECGEITLPVRAIPTWCPASGDTINLSMGLTEVTVLSEFAPWCFQTITILACDPTDAGEVCIPVTTCEDSSSS